VANTLYALDLGARPLGAVTGPAPVFWLSSAILAVGGYTRPVRRAA
jgi:hypothetical protein